MGNDEMELSARRVRRPRRVLVASFFISEGLSKILLDPDGPRASRCSICTGSQTSRADTAK